MAVTSAPSTASAAANAPTSDVTRADADIAAMRAIKAAFDPTGYLNPAVLFD